MGEGLHGDPAQRPLAHARKDHIAQLLEGDGQQARHAIGDGQPDSPQSQQPGGTVAGAHGINRRFVEQRRGHRDKF